MLNQFLFSCIEMISKIVYKVLLLNFYQQLMVDCLNRNPKKLYFYLSNTSDSLRYST